MTLPVELETSVTQLRAKHTALMDAVNAYRTGTIDASRQDLLDLVNDIDKQLTVEEHTLLGQVARKGRMPSLLLDFANGKYAAGDRRLERFTALEDILTFTRSTGGGRFNAQGQYEWVGPDVPRIDYDPVTGECKGLLIEAQRTNIYTASEGVNISSFIQNDGSALSVSEGAGLRGETTSVLVCDVPDIGSRISRTFSYLPLDTAFTYSVFVKAEPGQSGMWSITVRAGGSDAVTTQFIDDTRWHRISVTNATSPTAGSAVVYPAYRRLDSTLSKAQVLGFQLEEGSFPTSYIPTQGSAVTRAADVPIRVLGDEMNSQGYTFWIPAATVKTIGKSSRLFRAIGAGGGYTLALTVNSSGGVSLTTPSWNIGSGLSMDDGQCGVAVSVDYQTKTASVAVNGLVSTRAIELGLPILAKGDTVELGTRSATGESINGYMSGLMLYPFPSTESELQEMTSP